MGRFYNGDIEGKFMFGVQVSDDASFFGGEEIEPNYINYYFSKEDLGSIKEGIDTCKKELGIFEEKIKDYFSKNDCYNDEEMSKSLKISVKKLAELLKWYARLELGDKILKCVEENGSCEFEVEL